MKQSKPTKPTIYKGEIIEARQALFFISAMLVIFSIYPIITSGVTIGTAANLVFAISAFGLGQWSKTNPEQAFKIGFFMSLFFVFVGFLTGGPFAAIVSAVFSLAFYRGWKYARVHNIKPEGEKRDDILDDGI